MDKDVEKLLAGQEVKMTDPGGSAKGMKLCQIGALDPLGLEEVGMVAGYGTIKYGRGNYLVSGYDWSLNYDAAFRHITSWLKGQDEDSESNLHHLAHAAWHMIALIGFQRRGLGTDDRPTLP